MTAKCFSDTNIVLYTIGQDSRKAGIARGIVAARPLVSAQVINEALTLKPPFVHEKHEIHEINQHNILQRPLTGWAARQVAICL